MVQPRVRAEVTAIINAVDICRVEGFSVVGSRMVTFEIKNIKQVKKRLEIMKYYINTVTIKV